MPSAEKTPRSVTVESVCLGVVSVWEALAPTTNRVPTVTSLTNRLPRLLRWLLFLRIVWWGGKHFKLWGSTP